MSLKYMSEECNYLFVYGTLMRGIKNPVRQFMEMYTSFLSRGKTRGVIYDLGGYPGMVAPDSIPDSNSDQVWSKRRVHGEIYRVEQAHYRRLLEILDDYEECSDRFLSPHEYSREIIEVEDENGAEVECWAYILNNPARGEYPVILTGDYRLHLKISDKTA